jgi:hypothetical protein
LKFDVLYFALARLGTILPCHKGKKTFIKIVILDSNGECAKSLLNNLQEIPYIFRFLLENKALL